MQSNNTPPKRRFQKLMQLFLYSPTCLSPSISLIPIFSPFSIAIYLNAHFFLNFNKNTLFELKTQCILFSLCLCVCVCVFTIVCVHCMCMCMYILCVYIFIFVCAVYLSVCVNVCIMYACVLCVSVLLYVCLCVNMNCVHLCVYTVHIACAQKRENYVYSIFSCVLF